MGFIKKSIENVVLATNLELEVIDTEKAASIREIIENTFSNKKSRTPLWERLVEHASKYDPDGWKALGTYIGFEKATLFFDLLDEPAMYIIKNGKEFVKLLSECPGFVFYVTGADSFDYLVCHNDHDYLIGAGKAENWLQNLESGR
ncbi:MAG: hypothetical protein P8Y45_18840 [Exilibacterium sp.]